MKTLKLEVGKTYRSRDGEEVRIVEKNNGARYPYRGDDDEWYAESGRYEYVTEGPKDLVEEVESTRHTFTIPDGVKEITLDYFGNRIVVEMVPKEKGPKPGDVMVVDGCAVYIFKAFVNDNTHKHYAWLGVTGRLAIGTTCSPGRPATPEEAQPLWDALKKDGKRWNAEAMKVEDMPEIERILEWVERHLEDGHYNQEGIAEVIGHYLKHREGEK